MKRLAITLGIAALFAVPVIDALAAPQAAGVVEMMDDTTNTVWVSAEGTWHPPMSIPHPLLTPVVVPQDRFDWITEVKVLHHPHDCGFTFLDLNSDGVYEFITHTEH